VVAHARHDETVTSRVAFRALDDEEVALYAVTGEGPDRAGASECYRAVLR